MPAGQAETLSFADRTSLNLTLFSMPCDDAPVCYTPLHNVLRGQKLRLDTAL